MKKKKELKTKSKNIRNYSQLQNENEEIKDRIIRDNRNLFQQEEDYYKPVKAGNFWSNSYIKYESNGDWNKNLQSKNTLMRLSHTWKTV